jgi:outer membrane protein assembly factor BamB
MPGPMERPWSIGSSVVVPLWSGAIACVDAATGAVRWRHQPAVARLGGVTVSAGHVWFLQRNSEVVGLDLATGLAAARFAAASPVHATKAFAQRPLVAGDRLVVPLNDSLIGFKLPR